MTHILLNAKNDKEAKVLLEIAKRMNIKGRKFTVEEIEDIALANAIDEEKVSRKSVMNKLRA